MSNLDELKTALESYIGKVNNSLGAAENAANYSITVINSSNDLLSLPQELNLPNNSWKFVRWDNGSRPTNLPAGYNGPGYGLIMVDIATRWTLEITSRSAEARKWFRNRDGDNLGRWSEQWHSDNLKFNYVSSTGVLNIITG